MEYLFTIFHRLNTGGMKLNNQEIRNCIFGGSLNGLLKQLDNDADWRRLNKMRPSQSYRMAKQEIVLRFFAFYDKANAYDGHLGKFLNSYMHDYQHAPAPFIASKRMLFEQTVKCISKDVFPGGTIPKLSATVLEALLVGVAKNIGELQTESPEVLQQRFKALTEHEEFSETALKEGLSKKPREISRLNTAARIFGGR